MVSIVLQVHSNSVKHREDMVLRTLRPAPDRQREMLDFSQVRDHRMWLRSPTNIHLTHRASRQAHHSLHNLLSPYHPTTRDWQWKLRRIKRMLPLRRNRLKRAHYYWHCPSICLNPAELKCWWLDGPFCVVSGQFKIQSGICHITVLHLLCCCALCFVLCSQYVCLSFV